MLDAGAAELKRSASDRTASEPRTTRKSEFDMSGKNVGNAFLELVTKVKNVCLFRLIIQTNENPHLRLDSMNSLLKLVKSVGDVELHFPIVVIVKGVRTCLIDNQKEMRANAFRFLRHFSTTEKIIKTMFKEGNIEIFIVRTLTRDHRYDVEREQAIRLIRAAINVSGGSEHIPQSVVRILVSLSEQPDEKLKVVCLETLCELGISLF